MEYHKGAVIKYWEEGGEGGWRVSDNSYEKFRPLVKSAGTI